MSGNKIVGALVGLAALLCIPEAHAAPEDRDLILLPMEAGYTSNFGPFRGRAHQHMATLSTGFGFMWDRVGFLAIGRVGTGHSKSRLGWGGVRGYYTLAGNDVFELGPDISITAGGGKVLARRTGLLAAAEPGLSARLYSESAGAFEVKASWYQPLSNDQAWGSGAMLSLSWHPSYVFW